MFVHTLCHVTAHDTMTRQWNVTRLRSSEHSFDSAFHALQKLVFFNCNMLHLFLVSQPGLQRSFNHSILHQHVGLLAICVQHVCEATFIVLSLGHRLPSIPATLTNGPGQQWDLSEKQRAPAWCDRVLWRGPHVTQVRYSSHEALVLSDHKPVSALFRVGVKVVDQAKFRTVYEEIMKKLDKLENEFLPQVAVDRLEVQFERLRFMESQVQTLTVANTGQVPVEFCFRAKHDTGRYCKDWLRAIPSSGAIKPGETCLVTLELCVDKRTAWQLNSASDSLEDILVLHLERGKDIFISFIEYEPSCYGCSLEALARIPCPVRELGRDRLLRVEQSPCQEGLLGVPFEVPKELWLLVDHLHKYGLTQDDLFQQSGLSNELHHIRDALDARLDGHLPGSVHSMAEALLLFLDALPEPVVPYACYQRCLDCSNNFVLAKQTVLSSIEDDRHLNRARKGVLIPLGLSASSSGAPSGRDLASRCGRAPRDLENRWANKEGSSSSCHAAPSRCICQKWEQTLDTLDPWRV
ncbi:unnamed protein product, partial [Ixodes pacificus]